MTKLSATPGGEVIVYQDPDGKVSVDVGLDRETFWPMQEPMTDLFGRERSVVVTISVGYRVRSLRGTQFRIWA